MQLSNLAFIVVVIGVFYFLVIRPQQKRTREQQQLIAALQPGDEIVTIGGIYATVVSVDERIRVALADGSELEIAKQAIARKVTDVQGSPDEADTDGADDTPELGEADVDAGGASDEAAGEPGDESAS